MKCPKLPLLFYFALTSLPTATVQALKCYTCGGHAIGYCPENFIDADNTNFVKDCDPPTHSENKAVCLRYLTEHGGVRRQCSDVRPEEYQYEEGVPCTAHECYCFDSLCNGAKIDEIIKNGKRPVNPHTTTEKPRPPFKCYRCGDDQYEGRKAPPCPDVFTDDPKYIVECPQHHKLKHDDYVEDPKCTIYEHDHCGSAADYGLNKTCVNRDCAYADERFDGYFECDKQDCDCYTELCNGKEIDEIIRVTAKPFNPYTTTTTPKTPNGTTQKTNEDGKEAASKSTKTTLILPFFFPLIHLIHLAFQITQTQTFII